MNNVVNSMFFIFIVPGSLLVAVIAYLIVTDKERIFSSIPKDYKILANTKIGTLENKYLIGEGTYHIGSFDNEYKKSELYKDVINNLYFPKEIINSKTKIPVIVLVTSGFFDTDIKVICEHIVTWGFAVLTVKDRSPASSPITLSIESLKEFNNEESINTGVNNKFFQKFDTGSIGLVGFDNTIDAIFRTVREDKNSASNIYKSIVCLSPKFESNGKTISFNKSKDNYGIQIPTMIMIPSNTTDFTIRDQRKLSNVLLGEKVIARRVNTKYQDMIYISTGYVVAWLRYIFYDERLTNNNKKDFVEELNENSLYKNCDTYVKENY